MHTRQWNGGRNKGMAESDEKGKHTTKAVTDESQEEFIQPEARPSRPEESAPNEKQN